MTRRAFMAVLLGAVVALWLGAVSASSDIEGLRMVGMGLAPDSVFVDFRTDYCAYSGEWSENPGFGQWTIQTPRIDDDIDLLISQSFQGTTAVTDREVDLLLSAFDRNVSNAFDVDEKDLELVHNYLHISAPYDSLGSPNFELFPTCGESPPLGERGHVDFYVTRKGVDPRWGAYPAKFGDPNEDPPLTPGVDEFGWNSFRVTDGGGNAAGDSVNWPREAAVGAAHEFGHVLWGSNTETYGERRNHGNFNEFMAAAAAYTAKPTHGGFASGDRPFAQSLLYILLTEGFGCAVLSVDDLDDCPGWASVQDCMLGYTTRAQFVAYLMEHFHHETDY